MNNIQPEPLIRMINREIEKSVSCNIDFGKRITTESGEQYILDYISTKIKNDGNLWLIYPNDDVLEQSEGNLEANGIEPLSFRRTTSKTFSENFLKNLYRISDGKKHIILINAQTLLLPVPLIRPEHSRTKTLKCGDTLDIAELTAFLSDIGYINTPQVSGPGEFCIRGEVIDIYISSENCPIRIYLDWDRIEKMAQFDLLTQKSNNANIEEANISSLSEVDAEMSDFRSYFNKEDGFVFYYTDTLANAEGNFSGDTEKFKSFFLSHPQNIRATYCDILKNRPDSIAIPSRKTPSYFGQFAAFAQETHRLVENKCKVYICCDGLIQTERTKVLLCSNDKHLESHIGQEIIVGNAEISSGFYLGEKTVVFRDNEIFSKRKNTGKNIIARLQTAPLDSWTDLKEGDLVVHMNYGIGRFTGFDRIKIDENEKDYIKIEYANSEFYYVPLERANLIQKYIGKKDISLDTLHSNAWRKKRERALENAKKCAETLLRIYALRKVKTAFQHSPDTPWQLIFESGFEFEETEDQIEAIREVKKDMESRQIMDRIVIGDVGFGKTEIAFRAAFKAIMSGKQVCFLAPTTVLTAQHYQNFLSRCKDFPVKAKQLSRVVKPSACKVIAEEMKNGEVDIVFGTHKVLQKNISFKNLGLLIVDEEQRFGVSDKEKIKSLKVNVDTLTLSATPIPRTLYMSLIHLRDISTLRTPPKNRKAVEISIASFDIEIVKKAIADELSCGGQVFYLHNNTKDIDITAGLIQSLFPDAKVDMIHGKMKSDAIEDGIYNFANGLTDILVSTTIIENGIDIPNANTLIVDDATIYGTSQLYQIKGRIGRSEKQARAYLFYPAGKSVTEQAIKRIKVIAENSALGSGFNIAMEDLMLRGAGNILGIEQSGHLEEVGLDMYMHLLDKCIQNLELNKDAALEEEKEVFIRVSYTAYIPDDYIKETEIKFRLYKMIANAKNNDELENIVLNVRDKYGNPPPPFVTLYTLSKLKIAMHALKINEAVENGSIISIMFEKVHLIDINKMLALLRQFPKNIKINPKKPNCVMLDASGVKVDDKLDFILEKLEMLM